ncbi:hypothetical protein D3C72_1123580 [compost metagenome]
MISNTATSTNMEIMTIKKASIQQYRLEKKVVNGGIMLAVLTFLKDTMLMTWELHSQTTYIASIQIWDTEF